jgi:hypothetical protein
VALKDLTQLVRRLRWVVESSEEDGMINWKQGCLLVRRDRLQRRAVSRVHGEDGIIDPGKGRRPLDRPFDAWLRAEVHPLAAALVNLAGAVIVCAHAGDSKSVKLTHTVRLIDVQINKNHLQATGVYSTECL